MYLTVDFLEGKVYTAAGNNENRFILWAMKGMLVPKMLQIYSFHDHALQTMLLNYDDIPGWWFYLSMALSMICVPYPLHYSKV